MLRSRWIRLGIETAFSIEYNFRRSRHVHEHHQRLTAFKDFWGWQPACSRFPVASDALLNVFRFLPRQRREVRLLRWGCLRWRSKNAPQGKSPLSSWNEGSADQSIVNFFCRATRTSDAFFVKPEGRITVFGNDGTCGPSSGNFPVCVRYRSPKGNSSAVSQMESQATHGCCS